MAKKKKENEAEADRPAMLERKAPQCSGMLKAAIKENQKTFGRENVYMGSDADLFSLCVPWPSLSLAWLSDINGLPVSKTIGIAGPSQSQKSSLGFAFEKMFMDYGAEGKLIETEGRKVSIPLMRSLMTDEFFENRHELSFCSKLEDAQRQITAVMELFDSLANAPGKEEEKKKSLEMAKSSLVALQLDSLAGVDSDKVGEKIWKEGSTPTSVATLSKSWWGYFRWLGGVMPVYPVTLIVINHLLDTIGGYAGQKYTPGGKALRFFSSLFFWVSRAGNAIADQKRDVFIENGEKIKREQNVRPLKILLEKSSLGTENRTLAVDFIWYHNEQNKQITYFDWHKATAQLLCEHQTQYDCMRPGGKLRDTCDVTRNGGNVELGTEMYDSKTLKLEGAQGHEIGAAVMANPQLVEALYDFFHIKRQNVWNGRMPQFTDRKKPMERPPTVEEAAQEAPPEAAMPTDPQDPMGP